VSAREPCPWDLLAGHIEPPRWQGQARVHRMLDEEERREDAVQAAAIAAGRVCTKCGNAYPATGEFFFRSKALPDGLRPECKTCHYQMPCNVKKVQQQAANSTPSVAQRDELEQLAQRAAAAVLLVLPPWTLLTPGSEKEALARKVRPGLWWPFPCETPKGGEVR
jgi:hypothetical protein